MIQRILNIGLFLIAVTLFTNKAAAQQNMVGRWISEQAEPVPGTTFYGTRDFTFEKARWTITFRLYKDAALTQQLLGLTTGGPYELKDNSATVPGASNAIFSYGFKNITILTDDKNIINGLGLASCNLEKGIKKDITHTGCSFFHSVDMYPREYDIVKSISVKLYLGKRSADLTTEDKRPKELGYSLVSVKANAKPANTGVKTNYLTLIEENFYAAFNTGNANLFLGITAESFKDNMNDKPNGHKENVAYVIKAFKEAYPDLHIAIEKSWLDGNTLTCKTIITGTNTGKLFGTEPTGKAVAFNAIDVFEIENNKIVNLWHVEDISKMMQQLK